MTQHELDLAIMTQPFSPVAIHLSDGTHHAITRMGRVAIGKNTTAIVRDDGLMDIIANRHVTQVRPLSDAAAK